MVTLERNILNYIRHFDLEKSVPKLNSLYSDILPLQEVASLLPLESEYVPIGQDLHSTAPLSSWKVPLSHWSHGTRPLCEELPGQHMS